MKSTGIVRKMDPLGRIVLPVETRRVLKYGPGDSLEIFVEDDRIILKKFESRDQCAVTGKVSFDLIQFADGKITLSEEGARLLFEELQSALKEDGTIKNPAD